jgi:hypothetical protein
MTPAALERLALSLAGSHMEPHFDRTSFRVGKKIFATMTADGKEAMVKATPDGALALIEGAPDVFFSYGGWTTRGGSLGVRLERVDPRLMRQLVVDAWSAIAPRPAQEPPMAPGKRRRARGAVQAPAKSAK